MKEKLIEEILYLFKEYNYKKINITFIKNGINYKIIYLSYNRLDYEMSYNERKNSKVFTSTNDKIVIKEKLLNLNLLDLQYIKCLLT